MVNKSKIVEYLGSVGLYRMSRILTRNHPRILMYHRFSEYKRPGYVSREGFERQIKYLASNYRLCTMTEVVEGIRGERKVEKNTVAITVDDGYADFYNIAYPLLVKYKVPATIFVTTAFVDGMLWLWPDKIAWMLTQITQIPTSFKLGPQTLDPVVINDLNRSAVWNKIVAYLLSLDDEEKLRWIDMFAQSNNLEISPTPPAEYKATNWNQLSEMQSHGIEIGGHTATHPSLSRVSVSQLKIEVEGCRAALDDHLGIRERQFCYPNGQPQDYTDMVKSAVRSAGFASAVVAYYDRQCLGDLYELRRYTSGEDCDFQFLKSTSGVSLISSLLMKSHNKNAWNY